MSGWLLILALLVLGGILSTLGDRLGSRVGKARLSLFNLRPRRTAVVITVLTGSLISALSLGLLLLVSRQLRVGLFELDALQERLRESRKNLDAAEAERQSARATIQRIEAEELEPLRKQKQKLEQERERLTRDVQARDADIQRTGQELRSVRNRIQAGEQELASLEQNLLALRKGSVVLQSGEDLATATVRLERPDQAKAVVDKLLQEANLKAFGRVRPGEPPKRQILLVPRGDVERLQQSIQERGTWVISIRSAGNVLRGESVVYGFPDVRANRTITKTDEVLATTRLKSNETSSEAIRNRLNLLLASAFAEVQRRGSLTKGLQFDGTAVNQLGLSLKERPGNTVVKLSVVALRASDTADPVMVRIRSSP